MLIWSSVANAFNDFFKKAILRKWYACINEQVYVYTHLTTILIMPEIAFHLLYVILIDNYKSEQLINGQKLIHLIKFDWTESSPQNSWSVHINDLWYSLADFAVCRLAPVSMPQAT
jgi:hypothetical protein